jgi:hypothetical protein
MLIQAWLHSQSLDSDFDAFLAHGEPYPPAHLGVIALWLEELWVPKASLIYVGRSSRTQGRTWWQRDRDL